MVRLICTLFGILALCSCYHEKNMVWVEGIEVSDDTIEFSQVLGMPKQMVLEIKDIVDLDGKKCHLPPNVMLHFAGGIIKNGALVGDMTKIVGSGACFDRVRILGTWHVPEISTSLFKDLDYDNSLKDVVALANPRVSNKILIQPGSYQVTAQHGGDACLPICGKTELALNGTVRLVPNGFTNYDIIRAEGDSVVITGKGTIVGDKHTHTGVEGEWGMGIRLNHAHNAHISGLTIRDCWGDCIYVGGKSTNVTIDRCKLFHGRRQGVSITSANGVTVKECKIAKIAGTAPEYAIDVEPNKGDAVDHVTIENVTVKNCKGGFLVYGRAENAHVGKVTVRNCDVSSDKKVTIAVNKCDMLIVQDCDITQHNTWGCILCKEVGHVEVRNNNLHYDKGIMARLKDWARPMFGKKKVKVVDIE